MPDITCKLTGSVGPAVKAHVIPRSLYKFNGDGKILLVGEDFYREKRSPIGVYDSTIVTKEGEDKFDLWDTYAADFFVNQMIELPWRRLDDDLNFHLPPKGLVLDDGLFDAHKIRMLCMSILWRASVSSHDFFKHVDIGPHELRLRGYILDNDPGPVEDFSIILSRWADTRSAPTLVPKKFRDPEGLNYIRFSTSAFNFLIKVDKRPFPSDLTSILVGGDPLLAILHGEFFKTKVARILIPALHRNFPDK